MDIKNKLKNDLVNFIDSFLVYNIDDNYLEDYILWLINELGFDDINEIIQGKNGNITEKINSLNFIKLLLNDEKIVDNEKFISDHCTPDFYIKNKINANITKNERMSNFFEKKNTLS